MSLLLPRIVIVTRPSDLALLVAEHGTREQARFALREGDRSLDELERRDERQRGALRAVMRGIPSVWRRATVDREALATFPFEPADVVVTIGADGLIPNVAKYLQRQIVLGVNPDPQAYEGILARHTPGESGELLRLAVEERVQIDARTLVEARFDDGQSLRALNEIFVGHHSHQSARYRLRVGEVEERQSSSGFIVATGTGYTGWARSIARERSSVLAPPGPADRTLALYVREAFPAPGYGTDLAAASLTGTVATAISEMTTGGVVFGDGIEDDFLRFTWGQRVTIGPAAEPLRLVA